MRDVSTIWACLKMGSIIKIMHILRGNMMTHLQFFGYGVSYFETSPYNDHQISSNVFSILLRKAPDPFGLRKARGIVHRHIQKAAVAGKNLVAIAGKTKAPVES